MCGPRARTNFPYNPNSSQTSSSKLLSATLTAKLHKCYLTSLQLTKQSISEEHSSHALLQQKRRIETTSRVPSAAATTASAAAAGGAFASGNHSICAGDDDYHHRMWSPEMKPIVPLPPPPQPPPPPSKQQYQEEEEADWLMKKFQAAESQNQYNIKPLEDDHIEQMIEELLHYGSFELCSAP